VGGHPHQVAEDPEHNFGSRLVHADVNVGCAALLRLKEQVGCRALHLRDVVTFFGAAVPAREPRFGAGVNTARDPRRSSSSFRSKSSSRVKRSYTTAQPSFCSMRSTSSS
jgi:hypothetical protein